MRMPKSTGRRLLALVTFGLAALLIAACGGSSGPKGNGDANPASIVPRNAAIYGGAVVRPEGDLGRGVKTAIRRVARIGDPVPRLIEALDRSLKPDTYERDFEPWLGRRAGVFVLATPGTTLDTPDFGIVVAVRDRDAAAKAVEGMRTRGELRKGASYRGIAYDLDRRDDTPTALVGDFLVATASVRTLRAVVDASKGSSLAESPRYRDVERTLDGDRLAWIYADPPALLPLLPASTRDDPRARHLLSSPQVAAAKPVAATLTVRADQIALEASAGSDSLPPETSGAGKTELRSLPGDAWLALATPLVGPAIRNALMQSGQQRLVLDQVRRATGLDLERDVLSWLGGASAFVRGTTPVDIGGGIALGSRNPDASRRAVAKVRRLIDRIGIAPTSPLVLAGARGFALKLSGWPQPIVVLARGDRVVIGFAASSARDLLDPQQRFDQSDRGKAAIASLGKDYRPSFVFVVDPLVSFLGTFGANDPEVARALPYLGAYRSIAIGTKTSGDRTSARVVASLREPPAGGGGGGGGGGSTATDGTATQIASAP
jgi:hypothetical protein